MVNQGLIRDRFVGSLRDLGWYRLCTLQEQIVFWESDFGLFCREIKGFIVIQIFDSDLIVALFYLSFEV